jgi:hypothetical protein
LYRPRTAQGRSGGERRISRIVRESLPRRLAFGAALMLLFGAYACGSNDDSAVFGDAGSGKGGTGAKDAGASGGSDAGSKGGGSGVGATGGAGAGGSGNSGTGAVSGTGGLGGAAGESGSGGSVPTGGSAGAGGSSAGGSGGGNPCGNGAVDPGEQCDGQNLAGHSCATVVGPSSTGQLACQNCFFDTSQCCTPNCAGKTCGSDGCLGTCGSCFSNETCQSGKCVCLPDCSGKQCGSDGCTGSCGTCPTNTYCSSGQCKCALTCAGKTCGPDGCGGSCGTCPTGMSCDQGTCKAPGGCVPPTQCPTTTPATGGSQYCLPLDAYSQCYYCSANCSLPNYGYQCTSGGGPPGLSGCVNRDGSGTYCCPQAACVRATPWDSGCVADGLPPISYTCHQNATIPTGCKQRTGVYYCCPS